MKMKTKKAPGKLMLGVGLTAATAVAAVAMSPKVRNMVSGKVNQFTDNKDNYTTLH